jgi:hypothetical protein
MHEYTRAVMPPTAFTRFEDGVPVPVYAPILTASSITALTYAAMSAEYEPERDHAGDVIEVEKRFIGWTCAEVMAWKRAQAAARGCIESQKFMMDRTLGKAVQQIHQTNVNVTLQEALDSMADRIEARRPGLISAREVNVIDVTEKVSLSDAW